MEKRKTMGVSRTVSNNNQQHTEAITVPVRTESCKDTIYNLLFKEYDEEKPNEQ